MGVLKIVQSGQHSIIQEVPNDLGHRQRPAVQIDEEMHENI